MGIQFGASSQPVRKLKELELVGETEQENYGVVDCIRRIRGLSNKSTAPRNSRRDEERPLNCVGSL
ncbi:hypothetical protein PGTUg99_018684 [Puccinia graminis f. sp. tritici]|uniref:Uncharacterized protein n=1 Tax=Puccinia graminis f. sp. tritici TaxID=56615 RepID=A0A5B0RKQ0_PUCGR|nr:hypothetical protein PGTUg99_018684 [Puccinia graminis f. sp. tritici]